jgi:hypothetical protein
MVRVIEPSKPKEKSTAWGNLTMHFSFGLTPIDDEKTALRNQSFLLSKVG